MDTPQRETAWNALNLCLCVCGAPAVSEQGGRRKNHEIGVSEFRSGECPPPGYCCLFKSSAWMKRYGIERAGCQSLVRDVTPDGLVVVFCDVLWMEALARAAFARVTCANSLFFI